MESVIIARACIVLCLLGRTQGLSDVITAPTAMDDAVSTITPVMDDASSPETVQSMTGMRNDDVNDTTPVKSQGTTYGPQKTTSRDVTDRESVPESHNTVTTGNAIDTETSTETQLPITVQTTTSVITKTGTMSSPVLDDTSTVSPALDTTETDPAEDETLLANTTAVGEVVSTDVPARVGTVAEQFTSDDGTAGAGPAEDETVLVNTTAVGEMVSTDVPARAGTVAEEFTSDHGTSDIMAEYFTTGKDIAASTPPEDLPTQAAATTSDKIPGHGTTSTNSDLMESTDSEYTTLARETTAKESTTRGTTAKRAETEPPKVTTQPRVTMATTQTDGVSTVDSDAETTVEVTTLDPCEGVRCEYGARCYRGYCQCRPSCPHEPEPVCGSDGQTHMSLCDLEVIMCHQQKTLTVVHPGKCRLELDECAGVSCPCGQVCQAGECGCTDAGTPVCASDANTYPSHCEMLAFACLTNTSLSLRYEIPCENVSRLPDIAEASHDDWTVLDGRTLLYIFLGVGAVIALAVIVMVVVFTRRHKSRSKVPEDQLLMLSPGQIPSRVMVEQRPNTSHELDDISLCVTPMDDHTPFTFDTNGALFQPSHSGGTSDNGNSARGGNHGGVTNSRAKDTGNGVGRRILSSTDTSLSELIPDNGSPALTSFTMAHEPDTKYEPARGPAKVKVTRPPSQVDNSVPEVAPDNSAVLNLDDVFGEGPLVTHL